MRDILLIREIGIFFESIMSYTYPAIENHYWQAIALGILPVPRLSHYIIDGFIWKGNDRNPYIKKNFRSTF